MAHILIIDDEASIQLLVRTVLESAGHSVFEAHDGGAALDILETYPQPFDAIILDLLMPKLDGFEFLSKLKAQPFHPPVIVLSTQSGQTPQGFDDMIVGHLLKPFSRQKLTDVVNHLLSVTSTFS